MEKENMNSKVIANHAAIERWHNMELGKILFERNYYRQSSLSIAKKRSNEAEGDGSGY